MAGDLTPAQHAALRYAIALVKQRAVDVPPGQADVLDGHALALEQLLGQHTGANPENGALTPGLTVEERRDRRGALTGRTGVPAVFLKRRVHRG